MNEKDYLFKDGHHALTWATEVLRRRRFPTVSSIYKELLSGNKSKNDLNATKRWFGDFVGLPSDKEDQLALALDIYKALDTLPQDLQNILRLHFWGDYVNERRLKSALRLQDKLKVQEGLRVQLSWRYPVRQIATILGTSKSTVHRKVNEGLIKLEDKLIELKQVQPKKKVA